MSDYPKDVESLFCSHCEAVRACYDDLSGKMLVTICKACGKRLSERKSGLSNVVDHLTLIQKNHTETFLRPVGVWG